MGRYPGAAHGGLSAALLEGMACVPMMSVTHLEKAEVVSEVEFHDHYGTQSFDEGLH